MSMHSTPQTCSAANAHPPLPFPLSGVSAAPRRALAFQPPDHHADPKCEMWCLCTIPSAPASGISECLSQLSCGPPSRHVRLWGGTCSSARCLRMIWSCASSWYLRSSCRFCSSSMYSCARDHVRPFRAVQLDTLTLSIRIRQRSKSRFSRSALYRSYSVSTEAVFASSSAEAVFASSSAESAARSAGTFRSTAQPSNAEPVPAASCRCTRQRAYCSTPPCKLRAARLHNASTGPHLAEAVLVRLARQLLRQLLLPSLPVHSPTPNITRSRRVPEPTSLAPSRSFIRQS
jgi:hypothetical protein